MVEHVIGNDGVVSPILISGTNNKRGHQKVPSFITAIGGRNRHIEPVITNDWVVSPELRSPSEFMRGRPEAVTRRKKRRGTIVHRHHL